MKQPPAFFEHLVVKLLMQMGYGGSVDNPGTVIGQTGDEGIDGIIREDKLGFSLIYIQAKRWDCDKTVGRPEIQKFVGALLDKVLPKDCSLRLLSLRKKHGNMQRSNTPQRLCLLMALRWQNWWSNIIWACLRKLHTKSKELTATFLRRILIDFAFTSRLHQIMIFQYRTALL